MEDNFPLNINNYTDSSVEKIKSQRKKRVFFIVLIMALICFFVFFLFKAGFTLSQIFNGRNREYLNFIKNDPTKDPNRINILVLGLRGEGDPHGGLLTDTIMVLSLKKDTGQTALISIPRDIYIKMPTPDNSNESFLKEKINFAYALGWQKSGKMGGLLYSKAIASEITGLYLDYVIAVDFSAFEKVVDAVGGINVYLDKPFTESSQFDQEFLVNLPAGNNFLDGKTALYYARSRFSSSDFDRARRQQDILLAIKNKAFSAGILLNPIRLSSLLDALGQHINTDMVLSDINEIVNLYPRLDFKNINRKVFDTSQGGLLYSIYNDKGTYILLPIGDNFDKIQKACREIFNK